MIYYLTGRVATFWDRFFYVTNFIRDFRRLVGWGWSADEVIIIDHACLVLTLARHWSVCVCVHTSAACHSLQGCIKLLSQDACAPCAVLWPLWSFLYPSPLPLCPSVPPPDLSVGWDCFKWLKLSSAITCMTLVLRWTVYSTVMYLFIFFEGVHQFTGDQVLIGR